MKFFKSIMGFFLIKNSSSFLNFLKSSNEKCVLSFLLPFPNILRRPASTLDSRKPNTFSQLVTFSSKKEATGLQHK